MRMPVCLQKAPFAEKSHGTIAKDQVIMGFVNTNLLF